MWYAVDNTQTPPVAKLKPISSIITQYNLYNKKHHQAAEKEWNEIKKKIEAIFTGLSTEVPILRQYLKSGKLFQVKQ